MLQCGPASASKPGAALAGWLGLVQAAAMSAHCSVSLTQAPHIEIGWHLSFCDDNIWKVINN